MFSSPSWAMSPHPRLFPSHCWRAPDASLDEGDGVDVGDPLVVGCTSEAAADADLRVVILAGDDAALASTRTGARQAEDTSRGARTLDWPRCCMTRLIQTLFRFRYIGGRPNPTHTKQAPLLSCCSNGVSLFPLVFAIAARQQCQAKPAGLERPRKEGWEGTTWGGTGWGAAKTTAWATSSS